MSQPSGILGTASTTAMQILSIDGGGYLGLTSASFLAELERHFNRTCHECFDLFVEPVPAPSLPSRLPLGKQRRKCAISTNLLARAFSSIGFKPVGSSTHLRVA